MALVLADRVLETTTTAGSGTITLAGAEPGYQSFSAVGDGNQTYYTITADTAWEVGIGTYTASGTTLSRDTVLSSSNSNAKVTFPAGTKKVFVTYPSEKSVNRDVSGNISASSGVITNVGYPSDASDAATKLYVDTLAAQGITYHTPVKYEVPNSTGNLTATYNNGTAGVGATLTNAGTLVAFVPDGVTASISDRVLVYNQTNGFENGVYTVTVVGSGATSWVLTRATDADTYALKSPNSLGGGDAFYVTSGNTGAGETYLCNNSGVISFGSTAISFVQISAAQVYSAGNGISLTNTVISLATPVAVGNGGTGSSATPGNGELLIGNGSGYTLATLTAGSGVSITNSAGSITLSATGLGGTVTAVTATGPLASSGGTTPDISIANSTGTGSVVLDQGATISSATITAALSASITTITGTSANITTVTGTTAGFSSAAITQLSGTSAGITTVSGTTTTFSSGTITQFGATSATIATVSGTNVTYSNGNFTSATVTNLGSTSANITTLTGGSLTLTSNASISGDLVVNGVAYFLNDLFNIEGVAPTVTFRSTNGTSGIRLNVAASAAIAYRFSYAGNELVRINPTGFFGILKTPSTALDVSGTITGTAGSFGSANITTLTGTNLSYGSATITTGNLTFSSTGQRITGDFTNATATSRLAFQTTTANNATRLMVLPSGTGIQSAINFCDASDPTNCSAANISINGGTDMRLQSTTFGTGTALPMTFYTGGSERMRLDTSGNLGIGKTATTMLDVSGTITGINGAFTSANITTLTGTTFGATATTQLRGASGQITTLTVTSANITTLTGTTFSDGSGNVRNIPSAGTAKTSVYTLAITDIGEFVEIGTGGGIDVPNAIFSTGNAISIFNNTTGNRTISLTITTAYIAGTDADKNSVTLATRGLATILFLSNSVCVISGNVT